MDGAIDLPKGDVSLFPSLQTTTWSFGGDRWVWWFSEDLREIVVDEHGALGLDIQRAVIDQLMSVPDQPWSQRIDVDSVLLSIAVDPNRRIIRIADPEFWTERVLHFADAVDHHQRGLWGEHLSAFAHSLPEQKLPEVLLLTERHGLTDLLERRTGKARAALDSRVRAVGERLIVQMKRYHPSVAQRVTQVGFDVAAEYAVFRVNMLRFVAMLPSLDFDEDGREVKRLLLETMNLTLHASRRARRENLVGDRGPLSPGLSFGLWLARALVMVAPRSWVARGTRALTRRFARMLIAGENIEQSKATLAKLRKVGRDASLDQLGELVVSPAEADTYARRVLDLIYGFKPPKDPDHWEINGAGIPRANISVKMSALCAHFNPDDPEGTARAVEPRLSKILIEAKRHGVFINMDAEHYEYRDLNFYVLKSVISDHEDLHKHPWIGIVVQAYLRDAAPHLKEIIDYARGRGVRMPIRLVKGAYWDQETLEAKAHGYDAPQFLNKVESDYHFQQLTLEILKNHDAVQLCVGSHNVREHCFARVARERLYPEAPPVEHQVLHRTSESLAYAMTVQGWPVRSYVPVGSLLVGMAYLVRRIMENSSQVGVLTQSRKGVEPKRALSEPGDRLRRARRMNALRAHAQEHTCDGALPDFRNLAPARLYLKEHRDAFSRAIARRSLSVPNAQMTVLEESAGALLEIHDPSAPANKIGAIASLSLEQVDEAVGRASRAQDLWSETPVSVRASYLIRAAQRLVLRRLDFAVLIAREAGKARNEALADVDEAVDFMRFYAHQALTMERDEPAARASTGVTSVIAPWNFPLAIACGMTSASLVAGNTVLLKSAEQSPLVVEAWVQLLYEVGVPESVLQHVPGKGELVGARLVSDSRVAAYVFTGSKAVGTSIFNQVRHRSPEGAQGGVGTKVIVEMGGKNSILVLANADLDEAVSASIYSCFGHSGQKCSAASRIFVDERIFTHFSERFTQAAGCLKVGSALDPGVDLNPVISEHDQERLRGQIQDARAECHDFEGQVLLDRGQVDSPTGGFGVGPVVLSVPITRCFDPASFTRRELFGPVVHLIAYRHVDEALAAIHETEYALTGGIFSQSDEDVADIARRYLCGNLYINRSITGARVAIEPFGGFAMSGTGPKAGGWDYLPNLWPRRGDAAQEDLSHAACSEELGGRGAGGTVLPRGGQKAKVVHLKRTQERLDKVASSPRLSRLWSRLIGGDSVHLEGLVSWGRAELISWLSTEHPNRVIPGQKSTHRWDLRCGKALLVVSRKKPNLYTLMNLYCAHALGNVIQVALLGDADLRYWNRLLSELGIGSAKIVHTGELGAVLDDPNLPLIILDRPMASFGAFAARCTQAPESTLHLRSVLCPRPGDRERPLREWFTDQLYVRAVAENIMRHGAPLSLD